jgi:sporulation protein YlmC with PRC-barrel domain
MAGRTINLELLLGRSVLSHEGKRVGRIEEIKAEPQGEDLVVVEYHLGASAAFERLSASSIGSAILDLFGLRDRSKGRRVPWGKLDLSDAQRPRLLCDVNELAPLKGP